MFLWFDLLAGLISNECIEFGNWQRLQLRGMADYVGMKQFRTERDLCLFDLLGSQKKEEFANAVTGRASANIMLHDVQLQMIAVLEALGYDGWISRHDRSDPRVEICLFRPSLCLREEECVVLGPQTDSL